jgi:VanZ family protein
MLLMMGTIFFLSNQPGDALQVKLFPGADKVSHMLAYGILAATVIFGFAPEVRARRRVLVLVVSLGVTTLYGVLDEYHQSFIPLRHPEVVTSQPICSARPWWDCSGSTGVGAAGGNLPCPDQFRSSLAMSLAK